MHGIDAQIAEVEVGTLKPHPLNRSIYGETEAGTEFEELKESIRRDGVVTPLVVTREGFIVSGNSRWCAAKSLGMKTVPVRVLDCDDPDEVARLLIQLNRQRVRTNEQRAREFIELKRIEEKRAKARCATSAKGNGAPVENLPQAKGKARDLAAAKTDWSGRTGVKAEAVVKEVDKMRAQGDHEGADKLVAAMNRSVESAYRRIKQADETMKKDAKQQSRGTKEDPAHFLNPEEKEQYDALVQLWGASGEYVKSAFRQYLAEAKE